MVNKRTQELKEKNITRNDVWLIMTKAKKLRDAAFISFLFLTGMRVSEVLGGRFDGRVYFDEKNNKVYPNLKSVPLNKRDDVKLFIKTRRLDPLRSTNWQRTKKFGQEFIHVSAPVLKGRKWPPESTIRVIPVNDEESPFIDVIEMYLKDRPLNSPMFKMSRQYADRIIKRMCKGVFEDEESLHAHWFRHKRHAILAGEYFLDVPQLKSFSGWKTDSMPVYYAKQNKRDIMTRMIQAKEGFK